MKAFNRVVLNTSVLYSSLLVKMVIGLFFTRFVLMALGETDYGIYMLVAGVVAMLNILNSNMANTSMRFMSVNLGTNDKFLIRKTFNTTVFIHYIVGIAAILIMEAGGWVMFKYFLNIPVEKIFDAKVVYQFMIVTTFITVISVPYDAVINAHEHIWTLSIIDVFGMCLKLLLSIYLLHCHGNLLIIYGFFMMLIHFILRIIKQSYGRIKFDECKLSLKKYYDKRLLIDILSFTGWNLFGSIASIVSVQIRSLLINMFYGVKIIASDGVANSASSQVNNVAASLTQAINPQLLRSEGESNREKMINITELSTKYSTFLFALVGVPVVFETHFLLDIWLKDVPEFAVIFCQLTMIVMLIEKFSFQIGNAVRAVGDIKEFQIVESLACCLYLPVAYFLFKNGSSPIMIYILSVLNCCLLYPVRLYYGKKKAGINPISFYRKSNMPILFPIILSSSISLIPRLMMQEGFVRLIIVGLLFVSSFTLLYWQFGMDNNERLRFKVFFQEILGKLSIK